MRLTAVMYTKYNPTYLTRNVPSGGRVRAFNIVQQPSFNFSYDCSGTTLPERSATLTVEIDPDRRVDDSSDGSYPHAYNTDVLFVTRAALYVSVLVDDYLILTQAIESVGQVDSVWFQIDTKSIHTHDYDKVRGGLLLDNAPLVRVEQALFKYYEEGYASGDNDTDSTDWNVVDVTDSSSGSDEIHYEDVEGRYVIDDAIETGVTMSGYLPFMTVREALQQMVLTNGIQVSELANGTLLFSGDNLYHGGVGRGNIYALEFATHLQPYMMFERPSYSDLGYVSNVNVRAYNLLYDDFVDDSNSFRLPHEDSDEELADYVAFIKGDHTYKNTQRRQLTLSPAGMLGTEWTPSTADERYRFIGKEIEVDTPMVKFTRYTSGNYQAHYRYPIPVRKSMIPEDGFEITLSVLDDDFELMRGGWYAFFDDPSDIETNDYTHGRQHVAWGTIRELSYEIGAHAKANVTLVGDFVYGRVNGDNYGRSIVTRLVLDDPWSDEAAIEVASGRYFPEVRYIDDGLYADESTTFKFKVPTVAYRLFDHYLVVTPRSTMRTVTYDLTGGYVTGKINKPYFMDEAYDITVYTALDYCDGTLEVYAVDSYDYSTSDSADAGRYTLYLTDGDSHGGYVPLTHSSSTTTYVYLYYRSGWLLSQTRVSLVNRLVLPSVTSSGTGFTSWVLERSRALESKRLTQNGLLAYNRVSYFGLSEVTVVVPNGGWYEVGGEMLRAPYADGSGKTAEPQCPAIEGVAEDGNLYRYTSVDGVMHKTKFPHVLNLVSPPDRLEYEEGDAIRYDGMLLRVSYGDGTPYREYTGLSSNVLYGPTRAVFGDSDVMVVRLQFARNTYKAMFSEVTFEIRRG